MGVPSVAPISLFTLLSATTDPAGPGLFSVREPEVTPHKQGCVNYAAVEAELSGRPVGAGFSFTAYTGERSPSSF